MYQGQFMNHLQLVISVGLWKNREYWQIITNLQQGSIWTMLDAILPLLSATYDAFPGHISLFKTCHMHRRKLNCLINMLSVNAMRNSLMGSLCLTSRIKIKNKKIWETHNMMERKILTHSFKFRNTFGMLNDCEFEWVKQHCPLTLMSIIYREISVL